MNLSYCEAKEVSVQNDWTVKHGAFAILDELYFMQIEFCKIVMYVWNTPESNKIVN